MHAKDSHMILGGMLVAPTDLRAACTFDNFGPSDCTLLLRYREVLSDGPAQAKPWTGHPSGPFIASTTLDRSSPRSCSLPSCIPRTCRSDESPTAKCVPGRRNLSLSRDDHSRTECG